MKERELKNGYVIKMMHEHYPMMQRLLRMGDDAKRVSYQRYLDRAKGLRGFLFFLDYVLTHRIEFKYCDFSMSQKWIRDNFQYGEFFKLFLEINFSISNHNSKDRIPKKYNFWDTFKNALYEIVQMVYEKNKEKELYSIYDISEIKKINEYYSLPFSKSILYDKDMFEYDNELFNEENNVVNPFIKLLNKKPFANVDNLNLNFTQKKDVCYLYGLTKREYDDLSKASGKDFYTFDFQKSRVKIKQKQNKSDLRNHINTKVILNNKAINETIKEYRTDTENFIYILIF